MSSLLFGLRRFAPTWVAVTSCVALVSPVAGGLLAETGFLIASLALPGALFVFAERRRGWVRWAWVGLGVWLVVAGLGVLGLRGRLEPRILGLPPAAGVMLFGLWGVPLVVSTWIYAASRSEPAVDEDPE